MNKIPVNCIPLLSNGSLVCSCIPVDDVNAERTDPKRTSCCILGTLRHLRKYSRQGWGAAKKYCRGARVLASPAANRVALSAPSYRPRACL